MVSRVAGASSHRYTFKDFPHSSHRLLLAAIGERPARLLDVGVATGMLGEALGGRGHTVIGIEPDAASAERARTSYQTLHVGDVVGLGALPEAPFDVIIAGDILEHLTDPGEALSLLMSQLAPHGRMLITVPNVAFMTVRLALLAGRFEYAPRGILDDTHLRFFTRHSLMRLLRSVGLTVTRRRGVPPPLPLLVPALARWPGRVLLELADLLAVAWPTLFAYQLFVEARR